MNHTMSAVGGRATPVENRPMPCRRSHSRAAAPYYRARAASSAGDRRWSVRAASQHRAPPGAPSSAAPPTSARPSPRSYSSTAQRSGYSFSWSHSRRTASSRMYGTHRAILDMAPTSKGVEPAAIPGRFTSWRPEYKRMRPVLPVLITRSLRKDLRDARDEANLCGQ